MSKPKNSDANMIFDEKEWQRYTRHIQLPQFGAAGQTHLKNSHVLVIGAGGLGSPALLYLAAAGIGTITIVDGDHVDLTNLQRQILFKESDIGQSKALIAEKRLKELNSSIHIRAHCNHLSIDNADALISSADLVLDCTDNFPTRYLINDICAKYKKAWVFASIHQFSGQCALFTNHPQSNLSNSSSTKSLNETKQSACFRCLFPEPPTDIQDCNSGGVLGVLPGMLSMFQINEALKYLAKLKTPLDNTLLLIEALDLTFRKIKLQNNSECSSCHPSNVNPIPLEQYLIHCESETIAPDEISVDELNLPVNEDTILLDVRTDAERAAFHMNGIHIPLDKLVERLHELPSKKSHFVYCQSGARSLKATQLLIANGFSAKSIKGGLGRWVKK